MERFFELVRNHKGLTAVLMVCILVCGYVISFFGSEENSLGLRFEVIDLRDSGYYYVKDTVTETYGYISQSGKGKLFFIFRTVKGDEVKEYLVPIK